VLLMFENHLVVFELYWIPTVSQGWMDNNQRKGVDFSIFHEVFVHS